MTPLARYFLPEGYQSNQTVRPCVRDGVPRHGPQWHVYKIAQQVCPGPALDVGCGDGHMLNHFFRSAATLGVDIPDNIAVCRNLHPARQWEVCDLDQPHRLPGGHPIVICADVIEHLARPEHLLGELRRLNREDHAAIIISTPERRLKRGADALGPPENPSHVREWGADELALLLQHYGFDFTFHLVPTSKVSMKYHTLVAVCRSEPSAAGRATI